MNQTEKQIEIIVVDDGSTDRTPDILKSLQSEDKRIFAHSQPHTGYPGPGRNHGISCARGEYVAFLDGDDLYHPQKIERILSAFEAYPEADAVIHDLKHFDCWPPRADSASYLTKGRFLELASDSLKKIASGIYQCERDLYKFMSLRFVPFCTDSIVVRKDVLLAEPTWFREDLRIGEDGDLWLRLAMQRRFAFMNEPLSYYRQRAGSVTGDRELFLQRTIQIHKENLQRGRDTFGASDVRLYEAKIAVLFFDLGFEYFRKLKLREARAAYKDSLRLDFQRSVFLAYLKTFVPYRAAQLARSG
jgi:glycosyltransferase involved in cell wall biosynthesis